MTQFKAYSGTGTDLDRVPLLRQNTPSAPREDRALSNDIRAGAGVTGTLAFVARENDAVSVEFRRNSREDPSATWDLGPVSDLPKRQFDK